MRVFGKDSHGNIQVEYNGIYYPIPDILPSERNPDTGEATISVPEHIKAIREEIAAWVRDGGVVGVYQPFQPIIAVDHDPVSET
jgi:hypothetical protein